MPIVYAMIADGTEETECLAVVDILRRAGIYAPIVSVSGKQIIGSHGIAIAADMTVDKADFSACDMIFLPGGMPGSRNLAACGDLMTGIRYALDNGKRVAAVCAAPSVVLGQNGLLRGKKATCFPGFEDGMKGATVTDARVVTDGNITTARGLGCAIELGLEMTALLIGGAASDRVKKAIQF